MWSFLLHDFNIEFIIHITIIFSSLEMEDSMLQGSVAMILPCCYIKKSRIENFLFEKNAFVIAAV